MHFYSLLGLVANSASWQETCCGQTRYQLFVKPTARKFNDKPILSQFKADWGQKLPPLGMNFGNVLTALEADIKDEAATMDLVDTIGSFVVADNLGPEMKSIFDRVKALYAKTGLATRRLFSAISVSLYKMASETVRIIIIERQLQ